MDEREQRIKELETMMASPGFWADKEAAQQFVQEYHVLKDGGGGDPHNSGNATLAVLAGVGGDDAELVCAKRRPCPSRYGQRVMHRVLECQLILCGSDANESCVKRRVVKENWAITYVLQKSRQRERKRLTMGIYIGLCDTCDLRVHLPIMSGRKARPVSCAL